MVPHILLEEIGAPYERVHVDRAANAHKAPAYLQLNPNGLIPVLVDGDLVLYETAAIALHLCDTHPRRGARARAGHRAARPLLQVAHVADQHAAGHADRLLLSRALDGRGQRGRRGGAQARTRSGGSAACSTSSMPSWRAPAGPGSWAIATARWTPTSSRCAAGRATSRRPGPRAAAPRPVPAAHARAAGGAAGDRQRGPAAASCLTPRCGQRTVSARCAPGSACARTPGPAPAPRTPSRPPPPRTRAGRPAAACARSSCRTRR